MTLYADGIGTELLWDLIAGVTPTYTDWDTDPTDGANITDGDVTTACTTGSKVCGGAWQYAYIEWDLGAHTKFLVTGYGGSTATAGIPYIYPYVRYDGTWRQVCYYLSERQDRPFYGGGEGDRLRLGVTSSEASTIAPDVHGLQIWKVG